MNTSNNNTNNKDNDSNNNNNTKSIYFPFATNCLQGKIAVITGGGSGICFEIANQFVIAGCSGIVIVGRREIFLQNACKLLQQTAAINNSNSNNIQKIKYHICDVRDPEQCISVMNYVQTEFNTQLDILVNGAAGNFLCPAELLSPKGFATVISIDTFGTYNMCHAAYSLLSNTSGSTTESSSIIINISATLHYGATWWQCHASSAKAAVDSLTRSLSLEWGNTTSTSSNNIGQQQQQQQHRKRSIRVVGIAPGPIANTPGTTKLAPTVSSSNTNTTNATEENLQSIIQTKIPLGRMGYTYEIGHAAIYLCLANYITGHTIVVDGGEYMYRDPIVPYNQVMELSKQIESKSRNQRPTTTYTTTNNTRASSAALLPKSSL